MTKNSYITIYSNIPSYNTNFTEGFETATLPNSDWSLTNTNGLNWAVTSIGAASGSKSVYIDNFSNTPGNTSNLISTTFDISSFSSPKLSFKMAYQQKVSTNADKLQVFTSTDCGSTWISRLAKSGSALATVTPPSPVPLLPSPSQFNTYSVNISNVTGSSHVQFKFAFIADPSSPGNYIFIDDINLYDASSGISTTQLPVGLNVYPNPSSGKVVLDLSLDKRHHIALMVTDLLGRTIESVPAKQYDAGQSQIIIADKTTYEPGVYLKKYR